MKILITKENVKSAYEIVRALLLMVMIIALGLALITTADAKSIVEKDTVKPSEKREYGVRSVNIDKSFAVDKHCIRLYDNGVKFDACVKKMHLIIDAKYLKREKK